MQRFGTLASMLHDLLRIHEDRINGYKAVVQRIDKDMELCRLFSSLANESRAYIIELRRFVDVSNGDPADAADLRGNLYNDWLNEKHVFSGNQRIDIINSCEKAERAIQNAYGTVLRLEAVFSGEVGILITEQLKRLKKSFNKIRDCKKSPPGFNLFKYATAGRNDNNRYEPAFPGGEQLSALMS
jgi:uncharacterized protein (TIGR02284 family)